MTGTPDNGLRIAALALEYGLIEGAQFSQACLLWAADGARDVDAILIERGWLDAEAHAALVERLTEPPLRPSLVVPEVGGGGLVEGDTVTLIASSAGLDATPAAGLGYGRPTLVGSRLGPLRFVPEGSGVSVRERLELRGLHSSGGIGEVWRAFDEVLEREVALKRLRDDRDAGSNRARFMREAKITGQLAHPGVVPVYDFNAAPDGSRSFYTMRFVRGRTLREVIADFHDTRMREAQPLIAGAFVDLLGAFVSVCKTVAFAHSRGIIHRDLKGENIMIGDYGEVVVLDWGLAKRIAAAEVVEIESEVADRDEGGEAATGEASESMTSPLQTMQGERLGTPAYMAPEQARGAIDQLGPQTDVYGLSAILYAILTGGPPFSGDSAVAVMHAVLHEPPLPPSELTHDVPEALEALCLRGLAKDLSDRPGSAAELAEVVQGWLRALAERRRDEAERERFFDLSLDLLALVDSSDALIQTNAAWAEALGVGAAERGPGAPFLARLDPRDREAVRATLAELRASGGQASFEARMPDAGGATRWVDWSARALPSQSELYLVGRDVTTRRESEAEARGLVECAPDATCVADAQGVIVRVNAQLERLFGYPREELIGAPIETLVPAASRARHQGHVAGFVRDPAVRPMASGLPLEAQHRDGTVFPVEVSLGHVRTPSRLLIVAAIRRWT
ncbi:protein kinase domain-containing protein [Plesiocystis pacifica]|uniref:protein kinase domain-containing protein n=1 Tax=Plesiocystis pacifica TaxID=191768 RepID=UPI0012F8B97D|nr:PAS domain S-box protein [Plesiocystis pacifica]